MNAWWRKRDQQAYDHFWLADDLGRRGPMPGVVIKLLRTLDDDGYRDFAGLFNHRSEPRQVFTISRTAVAVRRAFAADHVPARQPAVETAALFAVILKREYRQRRPKFEEPSLAGQRQLELVHQVE